MILRLSYKNIAIIGLLQVGVIVACVLAAGVWQRTNLEWGVQLPAATKFAGDYGFTILIVPLVWVVLVMIAEGTAMNDTYEVLGVYSGLLVLLLLLLWTSAAVVSPFFRFTSGLTVSTG